MPDLGQRRRDGAGVAGDSEGCPHWQCLPAVTPYSLHPTPNPSPSIHCSLTPPPLPLIPALGPSHPPALQVLQAMARFPDTTYRFPQAAYLKLKAHMEDFSFSQLCAMLRGLHAMQVAVEEDVLERAGQRMAALLRQMDARAASDAIQSLLVDGGGGEASQQGAGAAVTHPGEA